MRNGLHGRMAPLGEFHDIFKGDVHLPRLGQQRVDPFGENLESLAARQRRALIGNVGAGRAALLDDAGRFQLAIGPGDRVRIDDQLLGQHANRRQFLARPPAGRRRPGT